MRIRLALALAAAGTVGAASFASATTAPPVPVHLTVGPSGVCFSISLQTTHCVPLSAIQPKQALPIPPVSLPYRHGDEICYDPTPTSKGPCVPVFPS